MTALRDSEEKAGSWRIGKNYTFKLSRENAAKNKINKIAAELKKCKVFTARSILSRTFHCAPFSKAEAKKGQNKAEHGEGWKHQLRVEY